MSARRTPRSLCMPLPDVWQRLRLQVVKPIVGDGFFQEDGGFSSYGLCALSARKQSPYTVRVASKAVTYIVLDRESVDDLLGVRASAPLPLLCLLRLLLLRLLRCKLILQYACADARALETARLLGVLRCPTRILAKLVPSVRMH